MNLFCLRKQVYLFLIQLLLIHKIFQISHHSGLFCILNFSLRLPLSGTHHRVSGNQIKNRFSLLHYSNESSLDSRSVRDLPPQ